ncbi:Imm26 family immunity protein [Flavilitoribacter nigricans]|uniref:Uncharacterized protein n=1 Tax=Flavilitoribacter nigricans (strain ATCC 23147 / DSM 23189 / NBRC 102662 / NCIMB 1420 / SS-2) TaxID=1122177 RepID=A0A2D0NDA9_FLAN2|nr:Imm26 family immunity protein [Flavilitoribacter nigricans]PHN06356.1 hypothetical protein CRP01_12360 [Flavilitoribacter nigricans DSM 23189 = NBRC 102662]
MKKTFSPGTIFSHALDDSNGFFYGKILLDIKDLLDRKLISSKQQLSFFSDCLLVAGFDQFNKTEQNSLKSKEYVFKGEFFDREAIEEGTWKKVDVGKVKVEELDFPEYLLNIEGKIHLVKGEIEIPIPIATAEADALNCRPTILSGLIFSDLIAKYTGKEELIPEFWRDKTSLMNADLRFHDKAVRKKIFDLAGLDANASYPELCKAHKIDCGRLLEK